MRNILNDNWTYDMNEKYGYNDDDDDERLW